MTAVAEKLTVPMNDLSRAISRDKDLIEKALADVLASGYVIMGPQHAAFERALADYLGVDVALGVASGTDALELAIKAVMPEGRATVLTAANAGGYSSVAARRAGFALRYADVDAETLCVNLESVAASLTDDVGVVVVTHLYGRLTDIADLVAYCHDRGIAVVEDCAQAIGARLGDRAAGGFGDVASISFYPTKNLGALGDGGAVVTSQEAIADRIRTLRQYGWSEKYRIETSGGTNSRLDELQAAILLARLPQLDALNERRRYIISRYVGAAAGSVVEVLPAEGAGHVAHLAIARTAHREDVRAKLREAGVQTDIHFPVPDYAQPGLMVENVPLARTERATREIFSLPCFPELSDSEIQQVCDALAALPRSAEQGGDEA